MAVNKVVMNTENGEETLIDLTSDTVTPETLAEGVTAHTASGEVIVGTMPNGYAGIPTYHFVESARVAQLVADFKAAHPNSLVFGAVSDIHVAHANESYEEKSKTAIDNASFGLEMVGAMVGCDFIANLGDICWENGIDTDVALTGAKYTMNSLKPAFDRLPHYNLVGNHDTSSSTQKMYDLIGVHNTFDNYGTTQIRGFGYKDYTDKKVRLIVLNTCDYMNIKGGCGMSYDQKDFLLKALDLSTKSNGSEWQILILSHIPIDWNGGDYNFHADLQTIINAYEDGTTASIVVNTSYARQETPSDYDTYSNGNLVYNYSGKNVAKIIANIHGHVHTNKVSKLLNTNIVRIATVNTNPDLNKSESYTDRGDYSITTEEANKIVKVEGTAKDTAATFYCIDLDEQVIYAYGYGADIDRTIIYKDATVYTIEYNFTGVTSTNTTTSIIEGESFTATLTANEGYALDTVTVKMGGVDITSTAYANGVITIGNVTGDVVITAVAVAQTSYTNIIDTVGTQDGYRIRSAGALGASTGFVSGVFPANPGDIIRVYFPNGAVSGIPSNGIYAATYSDEGTTYVAGFDANSTYVTVVGTNGYEIRTPTGWDFAYMRVAGGPKGAYADWVVTINEVIE